MQHMRTWTAQARTAARPEDILVALTDPSAVARWSPVEFDIEDDDVRRLAAGTRTRVSGRLAGVRVGFDVEVERADDRMLKLRAFGPVSMDVEYDVEPAGGATEVRASVSVHPGRGLLATVMAEATAGLLRAGALTNAVDRIARFAVAA
jgi:polyketide cyclase/dehydrase/lipid transport protein